MYERLVASVPNVPAWETYFSRVNFTVSSLWVATIIFALRLCSISSNTYSRHLDTRPGGWLGFQTSINHKKKQTAWVSFLRLLVVHPVRGLVVGVYGVFVANLFGPVSLLVHVGPPNQFGTEVPVLPSRQLNVHGHIVVGFLLKKIK